MISYDYNHPIHFITQNKRQQNLAKAFYLMLLSQIIFSLFNLNRNKINSKNYILFPQNFKIPAILFCFFICDEFERIFLLFFYVFAVQ